MACDHHPGNTDVKYMDLTYKKLHLEEHCNECGMYRYGMAEPLRVEDMSHANLSSTRDDVADALHEHIYDVIDYVEVELVFSLEYPREGAVFRDKKFEITELGEWET